MLIVKSNKSIEVTEITFNSIIEAYYLLVDSLIDVINKDKLLFIFKNEEELEVFAENFKNTEYSTLATIHHNDNGDKKTFIPPLGEIFVIVSRTKKSLLEEYKYNDEIRSKILKI